MTITSTTAPGRSVRRSRGLLGARLTLMASGDGWSLVGADGEVAFHGLGLKGRRECLKFAREHGVSTVCS